MTPSHAPRARRALVVSVAAAALLSSCSSHPGTAAVVGSSTISDGHLSRVSRAFCSADALAAQGQGGTGSSQLSTRLERQSTLGYLVDSELSRQYAASLGVKPDLTQVTATLTSLKSTLAQVPAARRSVLRSTLSEIFEGQLALLDIGKSALEARGATKVTQQQAAQAGTQLRTAWVRKNLKVSIDPRYGKFAGGALKPADGSLSAAASAQAVAGGKTKPSSAWVAALPASQKCS